MDSVRFVSTAMSEREDRQTQEMLKSSESVFNILSEGQAMPGSRVLPGDWRAL